LTVEGALAAADRLQTDKDTLHKLRLVLQTHLRGPAQQLIDALYRSVEVTPRECGMRMVERGVKMPGHEDATAG
jgi:hypothetical protein